MASNHLSLSSSVRPRVRMACMRPALVLTWLMAAAGCGDDGFLGDPVHRSEMARLGPEDPAVPPGPLHRPGQPCAACHRSGGPAPSYVAAGTVYRDPVAKIGVADADIVFTDSAGVTFTARTNCVGSFYVKPAEFRAVFPVWVSVQLGPFPYKMASPVHREASCAACHFDPLGPDAAGHVFVTDDESTFDTIPVRPCGPEDAVPR